MKGKIGPWRDGAGPAALLVKVAAGVFEQLMSGSRETACLPRTPGALAWVFHTNAWFARLPRSLAPHCPPKTPCLLATRCRIGLSSVNWEIVDKPTYINGIKYLVPTSLHLCWCVQIDPGARYCVVTTWLVPTMN